ncbi:MAG TPA: VOC family protein [Bryobacteraceae bacterium]|nr:VOC family protein [Bryobacteraceae bacterium]
MEHIIEQLLHDFENGKMNRRQLVKSLAVAAALAGPAAADDGKGFKAVAVNHISYQVADYAKTRDFYADLLGMKVSQDHGGQCYMAFGDTFLLPRTPRARNGRGADRPAPQTPKVDHIAYTIENWNKDQVEEELKRRGYKPHQGERGHYSPLQPMEYRPDTENSFHILDPDGFDLQISGKEMHA